MLSYAFMKVLEMMPQRYDVGISALTLGKLRDIREEIAARYINRDDLVLDVGCGTGDLAIMAAGRGARVVGIDRSPGMLAVAGNKVDGEGLQGSVELLRMDALDMDGNFEDQRFDAVVSTLALSELTAEEVDFILRESARVLRPNGTLAVADEVVPRAFLAKAAYYLCRLPALVITYILARTTTIPVRQLPQRIERAGFRIEKVKSYFLDSLELVVARRV